MRSYLRMLPDIYARKVLARKPGGVPYSPAQFTAFIGVLCAAEAVTPRGRFPSRKMLEGMLEGDDGYGAEAAAELPFLIQQGDLVVEPDGSLYVEGWDELQEGRDPTAADRMVRYRHRKSSGASVTRNADDSYIVRAVSSEHRAVSTTLDRTESNDGRLRGRARGGAPETVGEVVTRLRPAGTL